MVQDCIYLMAPNTSLAVDHALHGFDGSMQG